MTHRPALFWFRNDLRLEDNPGLHAACATGAPVIALYILDRAKPHAPGGASLWWLHHSLKNLGEALAKKGITLILKEGNEATTLNDVCKASNASHIFWNRRYAAHDIATDKSLKADLTESGLSVETFNGCLLREPWEVKTKTGGSYHVYTPFWKALRNMGPARPQPLPKIRKVKETTNDVESDRLEDWNLLPENPDWAASFKENWTPGESGARSQLKEFLKGPIDHYARGRDRPDCEYTSRLSPHLAFGEISPVHIWNETQSAMAANSIDANAGEKFLSEIAWREFSYSLLFHYPSLPEEPLRQQFSKFPWRDDPKGLKHWQQGKTGFPIVDAGMRQLWQTGWMHNRVRMIVASFLIKGLLVHWREGEAWFWDTLVDADLANNAASWQWVAGCGADASPYFRIFNPMTQGEKFDPEGKYVRKFIPELAKMPAKYIHSPWKAPQEVLEKAEVTLGKSYPFPILDHSEARIRALDGYQQIKSSPE
ncbi:MAG: deoxyribodipyrimidine photo-lyase [Hyphococcus sp.]|nr:MAG: deoxyribodipyrimidine photo-lyase [Marinicaulis sp.]